jgi:hypothetical protein
MPPRMDVAKRKAPSPPPTQSNSPSTTATSNSNGSTYPTTQQSFMADDQQPLSLTPLSNNNNTNNNNNDTNNNTNNVNNINFQFSNSKNKYKKNSNNSNNNNNNANINNNNTNSTSGASGHASQDEVQNLLARFAASQSPDNIPKLLATETAKTKRYPPVQTPGGLRVAQLDLPKYDKTNKKGKAAFAEAGVPLDGGIQGGLFPKPGAVTHDAEGNSDAMNDNNNNNINSLLSNNNNNNNNNDTNTKQQTIEHSIDLPDESSYAGLRSRQVLHHFSEVMRYHLESKNLDPTEVQTEYAIVRDRSKQLHLRAYFTANKLASQKDLATLSHQDIQGIVNGLAETPRTDLEGKRQKVSPGRARQSALKLIEIQNQNAERRNDPKFAGRENDADLDFAEHLTGLLIGDRNHGTQKNNAIVDDNNIADTTTTTTTTTTTNNNNNNTNNNKIAINNPFDVLGGQDDDGVGANERLTTIVNHEDGKHAELVNMAVAHLDLRDGEEIVAADVAGTRHRCAGCTAAAGPDTIPKGQLGLTHDVMGNAWILQASEAGWRALGVKVAAGDIKFIRGLNQRMRSLSPAARDARPANDYNNNNKNNNNTSSGTDGGNDYNMATGRRRKAPGKDNAFKAVGRQRRKDQLNPKALNKKGLKAGKRKWMPKKG